MRCKDFAAVRIRFQTQSMDRASSKKITVEGIEMWPGDRD